MRISVLSTAHLHIDNYVPAILASSADLVGIYDANAQPGRQKAAELHTEYYSSLDAIFDASDAVLVCSENANHDELVIAALQAGKHVLCEKPLSITTDRAERLARMADELNLTLAVSFPTRFNTAVQALKMAVDSQLVGHVLAFHGTNQGQCPGGWFIQPELSGGGALMDHIVHLADLMRWISGAEVEKVYAVAGSFLVPNDTIDSVGHVQLTFSNGIIADIDPSWSRPLGFPTWGGLTLRVTGIDGSVDLNAFAQKIVQYDSERTTDHFFGDDPYGVMMEAFIQRVQGHPTDIATAWDGVAATRIVEAAYRSALEGRVVSLDEIKNTVANKE